MSEHLRQSLNRDWPRSSAEATRRQFLGTQREREEFFMDAWRASQARHAGGGILVRTAAEKTAEIAEFRRLFTTADRESLNEMIYEKVAEMKQLMELHVRIRGLDLSEEGRVAMLEVMSDIVENAWPGT